MRIGFADQCPQSFTIDALPAVTLTLHHRVYIITFYWNDLKGRVGTSFLWLSGTLMKHQQCQCKACPDIISLNLLLYRILPVPNQDGRSVSVMFVTDGPQGSGEQLAWASAHRQNVWCQIKRVSITTPLIKRLKSQDTLLFQKQEEMTYLKPSTSQFYGVLSFRLCPEHDWHIESHHIE